MGWVWLALFGAGAFALLWRLGVPRALWSFVGAALMLGAAGYALQARPGLAGTPVTAARASGEVDPGLSDLRQRMFGRYGYADTYFAGSDALIRSGAKSSAINLVLGGIATAPDNAALWTTLGSAYVAHDAGQVSPPARFAFERAMRLAPEHPGPPFFLGQALVDSGQFVEARGWWRRAYRLSPAGTSYRGEIGERLALLERFLVQNNAQ